MLSARGHQVVVPGTERERGMLESIQRDAPSGHYLLGGTTVPEYAALIARAALVICNDSLPMHLADALLTPAVVLYAGTDLESQWRPRTTPHVLLRSETSCYPCYRFDCPIGLPCLDFTPEEVVSAALGLLARVGGSRSQAVGVRG
jgi:ADP-heptose:LPS heptosyltransferase